MGRVRQGGYIIEWWVGDHLPRHVHVSDSSGKLLGRVRVDNLQSIDDWKPPKKVLDIIQQLIDDNRL
jgi:hypothetical protein